MGNTESDSATGGIGLASLRVLFLGDDGGIPFAYEYTKSNLSSYPEITVIQSSASTYENELNCADVIVPLTTPITKGVIARAANLKLICQFGHDISDINLEAAKAANIIVTRIPSDQAGIAESIAEYAVCLALNLLRRIDMNSSLKYESQLGKNLCGMKAVVFGSDRISQRLGYLLQSMGVDVICIDTEAENVDYFSELPKIDILFFCCIPTLKNKGLINAELLNNTKEGVFIINMSKVRAYILIITILILALIGSFIGPRSPFAILENSWKSRRSCIRIPSQEL